MSFSRWTVLSLFVCGIAVANIHAASIISPTAQVVVRTGELVQTHAIPVVPNPEDAGKTFVFGEDWSVQTSEYRINFLAGVFNPDPEILYNFGVIDFGAPSSFGFSFGQPIVATSAPGTATASYSGSTTDGGNGAMTVTALAPPLGVPVDGDGITEMSVFTLSQDGGATLLNAGLDLGPTFVAAVFPSDTQGPFNPASIAGPAGSGTYNYMQVDVNFSLTGGNDAYTANGLARIVPEPASATLMGMMVLAAVAVRRRSGR